MFQTLVDVTKRETQIWKRILGDKYTEELHHKCVRYTSNNIIHTFHEESSREDVFRNMHDIFLEGFTKLNHDLHLSIDPKHAVDVFLDEHSKAEPYQETEEFLKTIKDEIKICITSDADLVMVEPLLKKYDIKDFFVSETSNSYKKNLSGLIFKDILSHFDVKPSEVLHVGDSSSDIVGANNMAIDVCLINRTGESYHFSGKPDYEINSLNEIIEIIEERKGLFRT